VADPKIVECPAALWRVGRASSLLQFSEIDPVDATVPNAGNRFDVPGGDVLYAATAADGAYAETIARYRPSPKMKLLDTTGDGHLMNVGSVPAEWRLNRRLATIALEQPLPFLDVEATATHTWLTEKMAPQLTALGISDLDVATVRGPNRLLTRAIAQVAYVQLDESGDELAYSGIRYMSRLGDHECWAIFGGTVVTLALEQTIEKRDSALERVAHEFGLTVH
jgi:hypothetical protein